MPDQLKSIPALIGLVSQDDRNTPASRDEILSCEKRLGIELQPQLRACLRCTNGVWLKAGDIWDTQSIADRNFAYLDDPKSEGMVMFGSDGGGEFFAFLMDGEEFTPGVFAIPVTMNKDDAELIADDLQHLLNKLHFMDEKDSIFD